MKPALLELTNVSFAVPTKSGKIVDNVSLTINESDFIVLLGANGSGKSSLLKLMSRTYQRASGDILLRGKSIDNYAHRDFAHHILTITQSTSDNLFMDMTIYENAKLYHASMRNPRVKKVIKKEFADYLLDFNPKLSENIDTPVYKLSGGERQVLVLGLCLQLNPLILLLDEHTSALDPKISEQIMLTTYQQAVQRGVTCVMTTHNLQHAVRFGNRLIAMQNGKIAHSINESEKSKLTHEDLLIMCYEG
jgi:putative ABC transport system ATP-binding protein